MTARWRLQVITDMTAGVGVRQGARDEQAAMARLRQYTAGRR